MCSGMTPPGTLKTPRRAERCFWSPSSCILSNLVPPLCNQGPQRPQARPLRTRRLKEGLRTGEGGETTRRGRTEHRDVRSPGDSTMSPGSGLGPWSRGLIGTPAPSPRPPQRPEPQAHPAFHRPVVGGRGEDDHIQTVDEEVEVEDALDESVPLVLQKAVERLH